MPGKEGVARSDTFLALCPFPHLLKVVVNHSFSERIFFFFYARAIKRQQPKRCGHALGCDWKVAMLCSGRAAEIAPSR